MTEPVQCVMCQRFTLQDPRHAATFDAQVKRIARDMALMGFGNCKLRPSAQFHSATRPHECPSFVPVEGDDLKKRTEWLTRFTTPSNTGATP